MRRNLRKILILLLCMIILASTNCFAKENELNVKELISKEEGSLFDKTIAKTIRGTCTSCL